MDEEEIPKIKLNFNLNKKKQIILLISLSLIFCSLIYLKFFCHEYTTITYPDGCQEVYIDGVINGTECEQYLKTDKEFNVDFTKINVTL